MDLELAGKVAVVTGASKGIGLAVTRALAEEGVQRGRRRPRRSATTWPSSSPTGTPYDRVQVDLSTPDGPGRLVEEAISAFGGLDVLVNNVGAVRPRPDGFLSDHRRRLDRDLLINFMTAVRATRAALPHLIERRGSDRDHLLGQRLPPGPAGHRLQRRQGRAGQLLQGAVEGGRAPRRPREHGQPRPGRHRPLARRPGVASVPSPEPAAATPDAVAKQAAAQSATGRFTTPEEVADLVVLLASGRAGNVTGADFVIDGGLVTTL